MFIIETITALIGVVGVVSLLIGVSVGLPSDA